MTALRRRSPFSSGVKRAGSSPPFAGVRLAAEPVHGDGQRLVRLGADRAVGHGAGGEAPEDRLGRLHLLDRNRFGRRLQLQQAAQGRALPALVVDEIGVLAINGRLVAAAGVLQLEHRLRIEQVVLAVAAPLVLAARVELVVLSAAVDERPRVPPDDLLGHRVDADAADARRGPREAAVDEGLVEADRLEDLRAPVALQRGDAHLGHHLQHALRAGLDVVANRLRPVDVLQLAVGEQLLDGLEGEIRVDHGGAVPHEQRHVVTLAGLAGLDDQRAARAGALAHEMVVDAGRGEQGRDRRVLPIYAAVGQHQQRRPAGDRFARGPAQLVHRRLQAGGAGPRVEQHGQRRGPERRIVQMQELGQIVVRDDRRVDLDVVARPCIGREQVGLGSQGRTHVGDQLLADGVERRIGHLGEELLEIVVEQPRAIREHRERRVGAHRADRLCPVPDHRREDYPQVLLGEAEGALPGAQRLLRRGRRGRRGRGRRQVVDVDKLLLQPRGVRLLPCEVALDLLVVDDAPLGRVDQEDAARMQPILDQHVLRRDVEDAHLGRHDHHVVLRDVVARGPQPVAVEHRPDDGSVGEGDRRRTVPGLHERGVVRVERLALRAHRLVVAPRLRNHHQDGVGERPAGQGQELEHVVEGRGIALALADQRKHLLEVVAEKVRPAQRLARPHPVDVAPQRVDLAVVGAVAVRVGQRPRRERVGAEPGMDEREGRLDVGVREIGEHPLDLVGDQHALVDDGVRRQAGDVEQVALAKPEPVGLVRRPVADDVELALEPRRRVAGAVERRIAADEDLANDGLAALRGSPEVSAVGRHVAPAEQVLALFDDDAPERLLRLPPLGGVARQEHHADAVGPGGGQPEAGRVRGLAEELVRQLQQHAGAVARVHLAAAGAAVQQVDRHFERLPDELVRPLALDVHDEPDAARVVLEARVVQPLGARRRAGGAGRGA